MAHCTSKRKNKKEQEILKAKYNNEKNSGNYLRQTIYFSEEKNRYIKYYKGARWTKLKKTSHKIIRRSKTEKPTNKEFDLKWEYY